MFESTLFVLGQKQRLSVVPGLGASPALPHLVYGWTVGKTSAPGV